MVVGGTLIAARLWAEGSLVPEINQCGLINTGRPPPSYTLKNIRRETAAGGAEDLHDCEIILTIEGYRDLVLHGYFYEPEAEADLDRDKLSEMTREIGLAEVLQAGRDIVEGRVRGRIVVKIG